MIEIYEKVLGDNLTIRQTEELIREVLYEIKTKGSFLRSKEKAEIIMDIENKYPGVKANISQTRTRARIILEVKESLEKTTQFLKDLTHSF